MSDEGAIRDLVTQFLSAFTSGPGSDERLDGLAGLFHPQAVITSAASGTPVVYDVAGFIEPRRALLGGGGLVDFREWPLEGDVEIFGDVAHWWGSYAKAGVQDGEDFAGRGRKSLQFLRTADGWRIIAAAWDDERAGVPFDG